jgi:hypothetical protein
VPRRLQAVEEQVKVLEDGQLKPWDTLMSADAFDAWMRPNRLAVEAALQAWVPADAPAGLGQAMRYGVLDGGKRLRPLLVLAACEAPAGRACRPRCGPRWRWN